MATTLQPRLSILCIDDEPDFLEVSKAYLERDGSIRLTTATSAKDALLLLRQNSYDAIISDYQMPGMDGIALLRKIRSDGDSTPFIIFTGKGREDVVIQALNEGADFYLQKGGHPRPLYTELAHKVRHSVEKRAADLALRRSERRLKRAEEVAGVGNWELSLDEGVMRGSLGAMEVYGVDEPAMSFDVIKDIPLPEYRHVLDEAMRNLIEKGERYDVTIKIKRPDDGRIRDIRSYAEYDPVRNVVFGVLHDVTEQRQAIEALEEAQNQLRMTMDLAKLVTWEYDFASDEFTFDDHFYAIFGTAARKEGGTRMSSSTYAERFLPPEESHVVKDEILKASMATDPDHVGRLEHGFIHRNDGRGTMAVVYRVVMDPTGKVIKTFGANQDITDLRNVESSLHRANTKLELLSSITKHDISNQLAIMRGSLTLLRAGEADPQRLGRFDSIDSAIDITEKAFEFIREYQMASTGAPRWTNIPETIRKLAISGNIDQLSMGNRMVDLEVLADPMLRIVFHNLLDDSIKHAAKPTNVRIDCEMRGDELVIIYEDLGPGIPDAMKAAVFQRGGGRGSGMGLFLSREILADSNIAISEVGRPGKGVRFELLVPYGSYRFRHAGA